MSPVIRTRAPVAPRWRGLCMVLALMAGGTGSARMAHGAAAPGVAPVVLAPHRAVYDLTLESVSGGEIVSASGSMTYVLSDACSAWSTQQELNLQTASRSGTQTEMKTDYAVLEDKDGGHMVFRTHQYGSGVAEEKISGEATMTATGGQVRYTQPTPHVVPLAAGTVFPVGHTRAIIAAARAGQASIDPVLFDGTTEKGAIDTFVVLMGWKPPPTATDIAALSHLGSVVTHVAYYDHATHDMPPDFDVGMRYFENGVSDRLDMNFGEFRMRGTLRTFTPLPAPRHCSVMVQPPAR
ncbi:cell envelope integrity EipB family protein [Novacetimonas pomaceti]|nr:cell envelope integrity EipB family protein [Novacetimonas pomaceti]